MFAESLYARVDQAMVSEINEAVDNPLVTFLSILPCSLSEEAKLELRQKWLMQHYVTQVDEVVEKIKRCSRCRSPTSGVHRTLNRSPFERVQGRDDGAN